VADQRLHVFAMVGVDRDSSACLNFDREPADDDGLTELIAELVGEARAGSGV